MLAADVAFTALIRSRVGRLCLLFCVELLVLAVFYQFFAQIECYRLEQWGTCSFLRSLLARSVIVMAVSVLLILAWPAAFARFVQASEAHAARALPRAVHFAGLALLFVPLVLAWGQDLGAMFALAVWPWAIGAALAAGGGILWIAPPRAWAGLLAQDRFAMVPILLLAAALPDIADSLRPLWDWSVLTDVTFAAVDTVLNWFSTGVYSDPPQLLIGIVDDATEFVVHIGQPCSGVEGFALISSFVLIYGYVFRRDLRLPRYWLVVLPLGLLLSWVLNVVRISALILIGAAVSPDLAVNGFHSYAGWMFFTLLALGLVWAAQVTPWLHRGGSVPKAGLPLFQDMIAASILPFVAMLLISTLLSAFLVEPELGYPAKVVVMAAALAGFVPLLRRLPMQWDAVALLAGGAVGLVWVWLAGMPNAGLAGALAGLPALGLAVWIGFRLIGTVVLVPVIEELFFRGYLLARLDGSQPWRRALAILISSLAFGALHGRYVVAGLAGVVFALAMLRRGRVTDAMQAHVMANLVVAIYALIRGDFSLI